MKFSLHHYLPGLCAVLAFAVSFYAQKPAPTATPPDEGPTKVFEVRLPVTVTEGKKKDLVKGLAKGDFRSSRTGFLRTSPSFLMKRPIRLYSLEY
jgi:hypothetical protein